MGGVGGGRLEGRGGGRGGRERWEVGEVGGEVGGSTNPDRLKETEGDTNRTEPNRNTHVDLYSRYGGG